MPNPNNDYAILVGITRYGRLQPLNGPERDALAFYEWLVDTAKGNVPKDNVIMVTSGDFPVKPGDPPPGQPSMETIELKFEELRDRVKAAIDQTGERPRRLYIFLAGHGLSWDADSAALLTANADYSRRRGYHVAGRGFAEWFRNAAYFKEIILLMDCCRNDYPDTPERVPWIKETDPERVNVRRFYAFATKGGFEARERLLPPDNKSKGLFTYVLMEALEKASPDPNGRLTGQEVRKYLLNRLPQLAIAQFPQEPHVDAPDADVIVWTERPPLTQNDVMVTVMPAQNSPVEVWEPGLSAQVASFAAGQPIKLSNLPSGMYTLRWPATGIEQGFDVLGTARVIAVVINLNAEPAERITYASA